MDNDCGNYDAPWTKTFDLVFMIGWICALIALGIFTIIYRDRYDIDLTFFSFGFTKIIIVGAISLLGGLLCRKFCGTDEKGYIVYDRPSKFKVNYTRKLQHSPRIWCRLSTRSANTPVCCRICGKRCS